MHIGLQSGLYLRAIIDEVTGELGEVRTKFLGAKATRLFPVGVPGEAGEQQGIMACSSRPWLGYSHPQSSQFTLAPLITAGGTLEAVRPFVSEHLRGMCAVQGQNLLIFEIESSLEDRLVTQDVKLQYTPRNFARNPWFPVFYTVEADANTLSEGTKEVMRKSKQASITDGATNGTNGTSDEMEVDGATEEDTSALGLPRGKGHWASCIQAVDPVYGKGVTHTIHLENNEAALACACVPFESRDWEVYLAVTTAQHLSTGTGDAVGPTKGFVHIYKLVEADGLGGAKLEFVHKTEFDQPIYALLAFQGKLALGVGNEIFVYDIGRKALLRKSRGTVVPNTIVSLQAQGNRIVCGDVSEGATYVVFKQKHNRMIPFVDDTIQRHTTCTTMLDYETTAGGDKFGNIWIVRCPEQASKEADEEGIGGFIVNERSYLNGAPYRLGLQAHFYAQDIPMSMQRTALVAGGQEVLFWSGLQGTLGMFVPFVSREDADFFTQLEGHIRGEEPPIAGRDHLMYRSYYVPVKAVIDGDLCERFMALTYDQKQTISAEVERSVKEIERKVQDMRSRVAF